MLRLIWEAAGMKKLGNKGKAWLKGIHIFFVCLWVGTAVSMMLLNLVRGHIVNGDELWAVNASVKLLDDFIIIPSAIGCLITGILFSWLTHWGFTKFYWIIFKYVIVIATILFGTFFLGPWTNGLEAISEVEHILALKNPIYITYAKMIMYFGSLQALIIIILIFISIFKPWGKAKK
jgi:hypothetical protein